MSEIERLRAEADGWKDAYASDRALWAEGFRRDQAEIERLRAKIAKVEALADEWYDLMLPVDDYNLGRERQAMVCADLIRAALTESGESEAGSE